MQRQNVKRQWKSLMPFEEIKTEKLNILSAADA